MKRVVNYAVSGSALVVGLFSLPPVNAAPLPLVAGNFQIAQDFFHGDTHLLLIGDSLQNGNVGLYPSHWKVDKWVGQVAGPNLNQTFIGQTGSYLVDNTASPYIGSNGVYAANSIPPDGITSASPGISNHAVLAAGTAGPDTNAVSNYITEISLYPDQAATYYSGKWADKATGQIQANLLLYANPQGVASGAQFDVYINSATTPVASIPISTYSATPGLINQTVSFPAQAWAPGNSIRGIFRLTPGTSTQPGSNLIVDGVRYSTGEKGFQFANISLGGIGIDYFLDPANSSDETVDRYVQQTDTNTCLIWLGQNDTGNYDPAQFKAKLLSLMSRYRSARPDMRFILCPTYDTGGPLLADYARDMYEISQSDSNVLFINLYQSAGDFPFLNANYLGDGVHPNIPGETYFVDQTESLLEAAAAQVPEPGALGVVATAGLIASLKRRRRIVR